MSFLLIALQNQICFRMALPHWNLTGSVPFAVVEIKDSDFPPTSMVLTTCSACSLTPKSGLDVLTTFNAPVESMVVFGE